MSMQLSRGSSTAGRASTWRARWRGRARCQSAAAAPLLHSSPAAVADTACLEWATAEWLAAEGELSVAVAQHPAYGRGLVAQADIAPHEVILSVNTERVFASQVRCHLDSSRRTAADVFRQQSVPAADAPACRPCTQPEAELRMHWAAEMALRLLRERAAGAASSWQPWLDALPARVATPVEFTPREVQALAVPTTVQVRAIACCCSAYAVSVPHELLR